MKEIIPNILNQLTEALGGLLLFAIKPRNPRPANRIAIKIPPYATIDSTGDSTIPVNPCTAIILDGCRIIVGSELKKYRA
jgi:hypothetical protein